MSNKPNMPSEFIHKFVPSKGSPNTVLLLHGTGGDENDLLPIGLGIAPGFALLSPRGRVDEHGAARFFRRVREGVFDEESIRTEAAALEQFIRESADRYGFDPARLSALGYSNGANMIAALLLLYPKLFNGAVLLRATLPFEPVPLLPIPGTPILLEAGQHDPILPPAGAERLAKKLAEAGAKVEVRWQNLGHDLGPEDFTAAKEFFKARP
jgi:predicted esterase